MKAKKINEIAEAHFKIINNLNHKILKEFDADDIHDFRVEVKKLRAFLRLLDEEKEMDKPLIPKLLKTFYGYVGVIRNIQLHRHYVFMYITDYTIEQPKEYLEIIDAEKNYWKEQAINLMADNNFKDNEQLILKQLPNKLSKSTLKKFVEKKINDLTDLLSDINDDNTIHAIRKILKDILYTYDYINCDDLPAFIAEKEKLKLLTTQLGDFRDKCIQLEFLSDEYLGKLNHDDEKVTLLQLKQQVLNEKKDLVDDVKKTFSAYEKREVLI